MLEILKNKKVWIGIVAALILIVGIVCVVCWGCRSNEGDSDDPEEIVEVLPDGEEGLKVEEDDTKNETPLPSVDAPSSWDDNQDSQSGDSNNTTTDKKDENQDEKPTEPEEDNNISNDGTLDDKKDEYGTIL